jgi:hypothetical protein
MIPPRAALPSHNLYSTMQHAYISTSLCGLLALVYDYICGVHAPQPS